MRKSKIKTMILYGFCGLFITLGFLLLFAAFWFTRSFGTAVGFDAVLFTLFSDLHGTDMSAVYTFLLEGALPTVLCSAVLIVGILVLIPFFLKKKLQSEFSKRLYKGICLGLSALLMISSLTFAINRVGLFEYFKNRHNKTELFDLYYVNPDEVEITFPEQKRNLIYIYLESMEVSFSDRENNGACNKNNIPLLTQLAKDNINFSQTEGFGGARITTGATWTIAAAITQTAGVPLCLPDDILGNGLDQYSQVLPGIATLSDVLHENGYKQAMMIGSDASFAGQGKYFSQHGTDQILDLYTARMSDILPGTDYHDGFWGMEDHYLYDYAKKTLTEFAESDQPFALTIFTIDTHSPMGNSCPYCQPMNFSGLSDSEANHRYFETVIDCADSRVTDFLTWLTNQDFYENTTVIIVGDHNSMNNAYFNDNVPLEYIRRVYNCILNAPISPVKEKNREFTTLDMFPTTLAAMGCTIEGNRLGLGTNLFSAEETLCESMGFETLNAELSKMSPYYNNNFYFKIRNNQ